MSPEYESALLERAAKGDRDAAGEYLAHLLPLLGRIARNVSNGVVDPDDLLSEVIAQLLQRWVNGDGPNENITAYVARSMRNRVIDEYRSPRSQNIPLLDILPADTDDFATADLHREIRWLSNALASLPADQRTVLTETVLHEVKPRELSETLGRPSTAVSSLKRRARLNLRRHFLREILEENAPETCAGAAASLSEVVHEDLDKTADSGLGMQHIKQCPRCRRAWGVFASVGGTLGSFALLLTWSPKLAAAGANAAAYGSFEGDSVAFESVDSSRISASPSQAQPPPPGKPRQRMVSHLLLAAGVLAVGGGIAGIVSQFLSDDAGPADTAQPAVVSVSVSLERDEVDLFNIDLDFSLYDRVSDSETLTLSLEPYAALVEAPAHWTCDDRSQKVICTTTSPQVSRGTFSFAQTGGAGASGHADLTPGFGLELVSELDEHVYVASFSGQFPGPSRTLKATIHSNPTTR